MKTSTWGGVFRPLKRHHDTPFTCSGAAHTHCRERLLGVVLQTQTYKHLESSADPHEAIYWTPKGLPGSRCVKEPTTKSSVDTASRSNSSSWRRIIHLTPARLIPSKARSTATETPRTAQRFLRLSRSEMDSAKPVMYMAPATHWQAIGGRKSQQEKKASGLPGTEDPAHLRNSTPRNHHGG